MYNNHRLYKTIEKGTQPIIDASNDESFVPRTEITNQLKVIFKPPKNRSTYHLICGEFGTGKTQLVKKALKEIGHGIIYVDVPSDVEDFGIAFGEALNFTFEESISLGRQLIGTNNSKFIITALYSNQHFQP